MDINGELKEIQKDEKKISRKTYWKFIAGFFGIVLIVFVGYPLAREFFYTLAVRKDIRNYFEWEKAYKDAQKNDTFGGKTPQETYEMFIETLKKGDILSAAKFYYDDSDRTTWYKKFKEMQEQGKLEEWINEQPKWEDMKEVKFWHENGKAFEFEFIQKEDYSFFDLALDTTTTIPAGKYKGTINFILNKDANIWKIYQ